MKSVILTLLLGCYSLLYSQCQPVFVPVAKQPPMKNNFTETARTPYNLLYNISYRTDSGKIYVVYNIWNDSVWTETTEFSYVALAGSVNWPPALHLWGNRIVAGGYFKMVNFMKAPTGKYFGVLEYRNNRWDTLAGCVFDSLQSFGYQLEPFRALAGTSTNLYLNVLDNSVYHAGFVYKYDTSLHKFVKIIDYKCNVYTMSMTAGTNRLLMANIISVNNQASKGFCYIDNDSIRLNTNDSFNANMVYGIQKDNDHIYAYEYADDPLVLEFTDHIVDVTPTRLDIETGNIDVQVLDGRLVWVTYDSKPLNTYYNILCKGDHKWKTILSDGTSSQLGNPNVSKHGIFTLDRTSQKYVKLANGSTVKGLAYLDIDSNCNYDSGVDVRLPRQFLKMSASGQRVAARTDANGEYEFFVLPDTFTVKGNTALSACADSQVVISKLDSVFTKELPFKAPDFYDLRVRFLNSIAVRWNSLTDFTAIVENVGLPYDSAHFEFLLDNRLKVYAGDSNTRSIMLNKAGGVLKHLGYFDQRMVYVTALIDTATTKIDSILCHDFSAYLFRSEKDSTNNHTFDCQVVKYGYDPNHKTCSRDKVLPGKVSSLDYFIEFQNEGKDYVEDVVVTDTLSSLLDIETFEFLGASHDMSYRIDGRILTVTFRKVFLQPKMVNEALSKGYFKYRIQTRANLGPDQAIRNTAAIYFDINEAVITNTTVTEISFNTTVPVINAKMTGELKVFPNPSSGQFSVQTSETGTVEVYNTLGELVASGLPVNGRLELDTNTWPAGMYIVRVGGLSVIWVKLGQ